MVRAERKPVAPLPQALDAVDALKQESGSEVYATWSDRGVARALKIETVMQAIVLGVDRVRTDNDGENAPILHINESMGYKRLKDQIQLMKQA